MSTPKGTMETVDADGSNGSRAVSRDGTEIAYWTIGEGPPLLLVHGTTADHTRWSPLLPYLEPHATVHAMDRRGRGHSGDGPDYDVTREFEDVATIVDVVAEAAGSAVDVLGHSFGGLCALGGALLTSNIRTLVLYEPVLNADFPLEVEQRMDALLAGGDREAALETMMREVVMMPEDEIVAIRAQPAWQARIAAAHTITREGRAERDGALDPGRAAAITVPTLMVSGGDSPDFLKAETQTVAAALRDARIVVLEGQQHLADVLAPELFSEAVIAFLTEHR